jgi:hypothetical protein
MNFSFLPHFKSPVWMGIFRFVFYGFSLVFFQCSTLGSIFLIPFERELEWGEGIIEIARLAFPESSAEISYGILDLEGRFLVPMGPQWIAPYREGVSAAEYCNEKGDLCQFG